MMDSKKLRMLGIVGTAAGIGVSLFSGWVANQQQDQIIEEKVQKEMMKQRAKDAYYEEENC